MTRRQGRRRGENLGVREAEGGAPGSGVALVPAQHVPVVPGQKEESEEEERGEGRHAFPLSISRAPF